MQHNHCLSPSNLTKQTVAKQAGFTLIELMISLILGLLISAAVVQIYLTNARTSTAQKSASELQDASVFGLQMLESHIRLANLGNSVIRITDTTVGGGIVLTPTNLSTTGATVPTSMTGYLSYSTGDAATSGNDRWTGVSNMLSGTGTAQPSDQLTLQFRNITGKPISDCEGATIDDGDGVVERYFLRTSSSSVTNANNNAVQKLVLACDAGRVSASATANTAVISSTGLTATDSRLFGKAGQEFIQGVDQFKVLLGVQDMTGGVPALRYLSSNQYMSLPTKPPIISVKLGLVVHGNTPVVLSEDRTQFNVLGTVNTLKPKADAKLDNKARTTYESTSLLRNARVVE